jgi:hypothetical protein
MIIPSNKSGTLSSSERTSNDLIAYIDFSNDYGWSGNTANDLIKPSVKYSTPGGFVSVVSGSTAQPGYIDLDGSTDYLIAGSTLSDFFTATALTIDVWVKLDTIAPRIIVSNNAAPASAANAGFGLLSFADGLGNWIPRLNTTSTTASFNFSFSGLTCSASQWVNLFVTVKPNLGSLETGAKVFKPAGLSASSFGNGTAGGFTGSNFLTIGRRSRAASQFWDGMIGAIRIYNRVLSETEMNLNYESLKTRYGH